MRYFICLHSRTMTEKLKIKKFRNRFVFQINMNRYFWCCSKLMGVSTCPECGYNFPLKKQTKKAMIQSLLHDFTEPIVHTRQLIFACFAVSLWNSMRQKQKTSLCFISEYISMPFTNQERKNKQKNISIFTLNILSLYTTVRNTVQKEMLRYCFKLQP